MKGWRLYVLVLMTFPSSSVFPSGSVHSKALGASLEAQPVLVAMLPNVAVVEPIPQSPKGYFA